jgi:hypothetical protein
MQGRVESSQVSSSGLTLTSWFNVAQGAQNIFSVAGDGTKVYDQGGKRGQIRYAKWVNDGGVYIGLDEENHLTVTVKTHTYSRIGNTTGWRMVTTHSKTVLEETLDVVVEPDQWHHIAISYANGKGVDLYVDGEEVASFGYTMFSNSNYAPMLNAVGGEDTTQKLDSFNAFSSVLNEEEIRLIAKIEAEGDSIGETHHYNGMDLDDVHEIRSRYVFDGGNGTDTAIVSEGYDSDIYLDGSNDSPLLSNVEVLDLAESDNRVFLTLEDIIAVTDDNNVLEIVGNGNEIHLCVEKQTKVTLGDDGQSYTITYGDKSAVLKLEGTSLKIDAPGYTKVDTVDGMDYYQYYNIDLADPFNTGRITAAAAVSFDDGTATDLSGHTTISTTAIVYDTERGNVGSKAVVIGGQPGGQYFSTAMWLKQDSTVDASQAATVNLPRGCRLAIDNNGNLLFNSKKIAHLESDEWNHLAINIDSGTTGRSGQIQVSINGETVFSEGYGYGTYVSYSEAVYNQAYRNYMRPYPSNPAWVVKLAANKYASEQVEKTFQDMGMSVSGNEGLLIDDLQFFGNRTDIHALYPENETFIVSELTTVDTTEVLENNFYNTDEKDNIITLSSAALGHIDGKEGMDTVNLEAGAISIDSDDIENVEVINLLDESTEQTVKILSSGLGTAPITINGNALDKVELSDDFVLTSNVDGYGIYVAKADENNGNANIFGQGNEHVLLQNGSMLADYYGHADMSGRGESVNDATRGDVFKGSVTVDGFDAVNDLRETYSIAFWFNPLSASNMNVLSLTAGKDVFLDISMDTEGQLSVTTPIVESLDAGSPIEVGAWHHITLNVNLPENLVEIYLDGAPALSCYGTDELNDFSANFGAAAITLIDDIRIYQSTIRSEQASELYAQSKTVLVAENITTETTLENLVNDQEENNTSTGADDIIVGRIDETLDGGAGDDTLWLLGYNNVDLSVDSWSFSNFEVIDLNDADNTITQFGIDDVIGFTDNRNTLSIMGDSSDTINLIAAEWTDSGVVEMESIEYTKYVSANNTTEATLYIQEEVDQTLV